MKFPASHAGPANVPRALQEIDQSLGSNTVGAYRAAIAVSPILQGLAVLLDEECLGSFIPSSLGMGGSYVLQTPRAEHYEAALHSKPHQKRLRSVANAIKAKGLPINVANLVTSITLHELGHAHSFAKYIERYGEHAAAIYSIERRNEVTRLPLGEPSSLAEKRWKNDEDGFRTRHEASGLDEAKFGVLLLENAAAYSQLPTELDADQFAIQVIASIDT